MTMMDGLDHVHPSAFVKVLVLFLPCTSRTINTYLQQQDSKSPFENCFFFSNMPLLVGTFVNSYHNLSYRIIEGED